MLALHALAVDGKGKILSHDAILVDDLNTGSFKITAEVTESIIVIKLRAVDQSSCPCKDGRDWVGRRLVTLLPLAVMASDSSYGTLKSAFS